MPTYHRLAAVICLASSVLGARCDAQSEENPAPAPPSAASTPNSLPAVRRTLREFDRFLDHHPLLEDQLRLDPSLVTNRGFLEKNLELRDFLRANPGAVDGLKIYPRYFLNRALLREASGPLPFQEFAPLRDLFQQQPKLEHALVRRPALIRDPAFLQSNSVLHDVLRQHPALARVFLPAASTNPK